jgi:hypothetical protein
VRERERQNHRSTCSALLQLSRFSFFFFIYTNTHVHLSDSYDRLSTAGDVHARAFSSFSAAVPVALLSLWLSTSCVELLSCVLLIVVTIFLSFGSVVCRSQHYRVCVRLLSPSSLPLHVSLPRIHAHTRTRIHTRGFVCGSVAGSRRRGRKKRRAFSALPEAAPNVVAFVCLLLFLLVEVVLRSPPGLIFLLALGLRNCLVFEEVLVFSFFGGKDYKEKRSETAAYAPTALSLSL